MTDRPPATPEALRPPSAPPPFERDPSHRRLGVIALCAFAALALGASAVVLWLPGWLAPAGPGPAPPAPASAALAPAPAPAPVPEAEDPARIEAKAWLDRALARQARLDNAGASLWGLDEVDGVSYPLARARLAEGDVDFAAARFDAAVDAYREADGLFERLEAGKRVRLQRALEAGAEAIARRDAPEASRWYQTALAIDPGHPEAALGRSRAERLPEVVAHFERAAALETGGDLEGALAAYADAIALDPAFEPAGEGIRRVQATVADAAFNRAMSDAEAALASGDLTGARAAAERARGLRPAEPVVDDLIRRVRGERRAARVANLHQRAAVLERGERWQEAAALYDEALALDPSLAFALDGRKRVAMALALDERIAHYLSRPERLYSADPLARARELLASARAIADAGPRLRDQRERLAELIVAASRPIPVVVRSDRETDVVIYRVGRLGLIDERRLELDPGRYTAVGTRRGYRDVRVVFDVTPAGSPPVVTVSCEERI